MTREEIVCWKLVCIILMITCIQIDFQNFVAINLLLSVVLVSISKNKKKIQLGFNDNASKSQSILQTTVNDANISNGDQSYNIYTPSEKSENEKKESSQLSEEGLGFAGIL